MRLRICFGILPIAFAFTSPVSQARWAASGSHGGFTSSAFDSLLSSVG
jgi:hypothetical protein